MSKVRTYGMDQRTLEAVAEHVYDFMIQKSGDNARNNPEAESLLNFLIGHRDQSKLIIMTSVAFAIGNFDRIEKVECEAELDGSGNMAKPEPVSPKYVT